MSKDVYDKTPPLRLLLPMGNKRGVVPLICSMHGTRFSACHGDCCLL